MLTFIGCGSAFNTELGNTSAYFKIDNTMYLIDCGSATFADIVKYNVLDGVKKLYIFITHTHPDHIGSLGDLIFYAYFVKKIRPELFYPEPKKLKMILNAMGVTRAYHGFVVNSGDIGVILNDQKNKVKFVPIPTNHVKEIKSWGYMITIEDKRIWYSGDSNELMHGIETLLKADVINIMYHDTCGLDYEGNVHLYYGKLRDAIPVELRHKIWCMHLDKAFDKNQAIADGFNVATRMEG